MVEDVEIGTEGLHSNSVAGIVDREVLELLLERHLILLERCSHLLNVVGHHLPFRSILRCREQPAHLVLHCVTPQIHLTELLINPPHDAHLLLSERLDVFAPTTLCSGGLQSIHDGEANRGKFATPFTAQREYLPVMPTNDQLMLLVDVLQVQEPRFARIRNRVCHLDHLGQLRIDEQLPLFQMKVVRNISGREHLFHRRFGHAVNPEV
mmetsp:Transcript_58475/g.155606  ORF Transcript_58475/g.155606 Transcript_58475/m.155606 type:complete len:209 (+) Transcript_58475:1231-1857(+)